VRWSDYQGKKGTAGNEDDEKIYTKTVEDSSRG
jgi:hypothetical protein